MKYYKKSFINNFPLKFHPQTGDFMDIADSVYEANHRALNISLILIPILLIIIFILRSGLK